MLKQRDFFEDLQDCIKHGYEFTQNEINKKAVSRFPKSEKRGRYSGISRSENKFNDYR